jgi:hypothetical protein
LDVAQIKRRYIMIVLKIFVLSIALLVTISGFSVQAQTPDCITDADCDDGAFCNGVVTCNAGTCQAGTPVDCGDGVSCTVDSCNESTDSCDNVPDDGLCDNGQFCDGSETCDPVNDCQAGTGLCAPGETCDEANDICVATTFELFDWGFYVDGTTYCLLGPCDFDVDDIGNINGPEDLPPFIDTSNFDFDTGLGSIGITLSNRGSHSVVMFVDHDIDFDLNGFLNETGFTNGSPESGETWEIDEPGNGSGQDGSAGFPYFGDIFFDNFLDGLPDNRAFYDAIDDQTLTPPDDVSMAMGRDFRLVEGESATMDFLLRDASIPQGFHLVQRDPDSDVNIYFSSSLDIAQDAETDCFDGADNDGDGMTDCADPDCEGATDGSCNTGLPGICSTGITTCQNETSACVPDDPGKIEPGVCSCGVPDADSDGDGMTDCWEEQIIDADANDNITGIDNVLPGDDFDSDGWSNIMEYMRGTDPTDPNSHPSKAMPWIPLLLLDD